MSQKLNYLKRHERIIFIELVNFIGYEAYRAAVITQYPDEYNRILSLKNEVTSALKALHGDIIQDKLKELTCEIVNSIVLEDSFEKLEKEINIVSNEVYLKETLDENIALEAQLQEEIKKIINVAKTLHHSHINWCTNIYHRCMPAKLISENKFKNLIAYIDSEIYTVGKEMTNESLENKTITSPVLEPIPVIGNKPKHRIKSKKTDPVPIPETSLFNRHIRYDTLLKERLEHYNEIQLKAIIELSFIDKEVTHVDFTQSLDVRIDLSYPMSNHEVELLVNDIRNKIRYHQTHNTSALLLMAENLDQLEKSYRNKDLDDFDLVSHLDLIKYPVQGVSSFTDVKNALLGLMAWHEHFIKKGDDHTFIYEKSNCSQNVSFEAVAEQFTDENTGEVKKGYGFNTIRNGYSVISVAIQQELAKQRYGRYQERKISAERKKALENAPTIPFSELHENDKRIVTDRLKSLASRGYEGLIKKHEDGSIWVVHTKK